MGELDDLEEFDLTAHHEDGASARRIRAGHRRRRLTQSYLDDRPLWKKQIHGRPRASDTRPPDET